MSERRKVVLPGIPCGHCGEPLIGIGRTKETPGFVNRERKCEACGYLNITDERVICSRPVRAKKITINRKDYL